MTQKYEIPNDFDLQCRILQDSKVFLGRIESTSGPDQYVRATISIVWIEQLGILHQEVRLENAPKEVWDAFGDLVAPKARIVPDIFDATRESLEAIDNLIMQLNAVAEHVEVLLPIDPNASESNT
jgi:hypothetical protein